MNRKNIQPKGPWRTEPEVLRTELNDFFGPPELTPGLPRWEAGMPGSNEAQSTAPHLPMVNQINDTWMEIPRYEGIWWIVGHDKVTGSVVLRAESHNIPDKANTSHGYASGFDRPDRVTLTQKENDLEIRGSFWVNCSYGSRVTLDVNYWLHKGDRQYQLAQTLDTER